MHTRLALHPDLVENALEDRTLLASFLDSTYFQYTFGSGTSLFQFNYDAGSCSSLGFTDSGGPLGNPTTQTNQTGVGAYASNYAAGSSYIGFGSNPFGSGLSPLDGVVSAYSMNTALSNELGDGSSLPGAGSFSDGFNEFIPGADASLRAGAIGGPVNVTTSPGDLVGPVGYGSSFSSGGNFSLNLLGGKIYGTGQSLIGTLSASATAIGHGSFEEPSAESGTGRAIKARIPDGPRALNASGRNPVGEGLITKLLGDPRSLPPQDQGPNRPPNKEAAPRPPLQTPDSALTPSRLKSPQTIASVAGQRGTRDRPDRPGPAGTRTETEHAPRPMSGARHEPPRKTWRD